MKMMGQKTISRRNFLRIGGMTAGAAVFLAACGGLGEGGEDEDENEMEEGEMEEDEKEEDDD